MRLGAAGALLALVALPLATAPLAAQQLRYSGSIGYAGGSYTFTERTESFTLLNGLALAGDRWSISATIPLIFQSASGVTRIGGMEVPTGAGRGGRREPGMGGVGGDAYEAVVGDPILRGAVTPYRSGGALRSIGLAVSAKAPVADTSTGVGTGAWDVGAGASVALGLGRTLLLADAALWSPGDMPDLTLDPYATLAVGLGRPIGDRWNALASLAIATPMIQGLTAPVSMGAAVGYRAGDRRTLNAGASIGLTDSAADLALYLGWSISTP